MIKRVEVITYREHYHCIKCGAEMDFDGTVLTSYPAQYPHTCPECGFKKTLNRMFPDIVNEEKNG